MGSGGGGLGRRLGHEGSPHIQLRKRASPDPKSWTPGVQNGGKLMPVAPIRAPAPTRTESGCIQAQPLLTWEVGTQGLRGVRTPRLAGVISGACRSGDSPLAVTGGYRPAAPGPSSGVTSGVTSACRPSSLRLLGPVKPGRRGVECGLGRPPRRVPTPRSGLPACVITPGLIIFDYFRFVVFSMFICELQCETVTNSDFYCG